MKKIKIILLVTLGICMLSFIPAALGAAETKPISTFTDTNDSVAAWANYETGLTVFPHGFYIFPGLESIADCDPEGSVFVKDLKDGKILYKVNLHVKGALMFIAQAMYGLIFVGEMDYNFQATMIVYDGELGDPVPNLLMIWFPAYFGIEPIGEGTFSHITGSGKGTFINDDAAIDFGFAPGATANIKINQVGILDPEGEKWPVELIFFH